jgi:PAS domain S-box-containing protein
MQESPPATSYTNLSGTLVGDLFHLLQRAPVGMGIFRGSSFTVDMVNDKLLEIWHRKKEEVTGRPLVDAFPGLAGAKVEELFKTVFREAEKFKAKEYPVSFSQDGNLHTGYFDLSLEPILNKEGVVTGVLGIVSEITEQVLSLRNIEERESRLLQTKGQLELSINAGNIGIWHWDVKNDVLTWSKEQREMFGILESDFEGKAEDFHRFVIPEDRERVWEESKLDNQKTDKQYEFRIRRSDGEIRWIQSRSKTFFNSKGEPASMTGVNIDITDQKEAEEKLSRSEEKYRQLSISLEEQVRQRTEELTEKNKLLSEAQKIAQLGNWEWDVATGKLTWSDNLYTIYGINPGEEISFEKFSSLIHPDDRQFVLQQIEQASSGKKFSDFFHRIITPAGETRILHARGQVITDANGQLIKMIGTGQDISESIKLSEEIKKMSVADKLKSDFIKMASHELKTPITSIKGYVQLLLTMIRDEDQKEISRLMLRSSLISVDKQVNRLTRLLAELLDLSRIESGQLELNIEEFSLNELVIDIIQDVLYTNPKHEINLYHDVGCVLKADRDRIGQVIINLLTNAIKYSPDAEKIDVTIFAAGKNEVAVSVKDFGIGIDKKEQEKIFERFYRAEGESEQTYPGFGIGLFIANEIITRHGGTISVVSEKGKGSIFSFTLPFQNVN